MTRLAHCHNVRNRERPPCGRWCSFRSFSPRCAVFSVRCPFFNESERMLVYGTQIEPGTPKDERRAGVSQICCPCSQNVRRLVSTELRAELNLHCGPGCRFMRISASCSRIFGDNVGTFVAT